MGIPRDAGGRKEVDGVLERVRSLLVRRRFVTGVVAAAVCSTLPRLRRSATQEKARTG